jgi:hypothetical protein
MLRALKVASESFLEYDLIEVGLLAPTSIPTSFISALDSAASKLKLKNLAVWPASNLVVYTSTADRRRFWYPPPGVLVLTVEWSHAALTVNFVYEDSLVTDVLQRTFNSSLGTNAWSEDGRQQMISTLQDTITSSLDASTRYSLMDLHAVALFGENGCDPRLRAVVEGTLIALGSQVQLPPAETCSVVEAVFAASGQAAATLISRRDGWQGCSPPGGLRRATLQEELNAIRRDFDFTWKSFACWASVQTSLLNDLQRYCEMSGMSELDYLAAREAQRRALRGENKKNPSYHELIELESQKMAIGM